MNHDTHRCLMECRQIILDALAKQMSHRPHDDNWLETERLAVVIAANRWAESVNIAQRVTIEDVERIEVLSVGHVDYASKLALHVAEFMHGVRS